MSGWNARQRLADLMHPQTKTLMLRRRSAATVACGASDPPLAPPERNPRASRSRQQPQLAQPVQPVQPVQSRTKRKRPDNPDGDDHPNARGYFREGSPLKVKASGKKKTFVKQVIHKAKKPPPMMKLWVDPRVVSSGHENW